MSDTICQHTLSDIVDYLCKHSLHAVLPGVGADEADSIMVTDIAPLQKAQKNHLSFLSKSSLQNLLSQTQAAVVIVNENIDSDVLATCSSPLLLVNDSYLAYALVSALFDSTLMRTSTIHPTAVIDSSVTLGEGVSLGANVVLDEGVVVGENTQIAAGSFVGKNSTVGENCYLHSNVNIYHDVSVGSNCIVHSAVVIGADGFGFAPKPKGGWQKIHQLGGVVIGSNVEIGAGTTIDRGALDDTVIADNVIIDNQVQIAHNVSIGRNTAIAACTGIAGSTTIGENCTIAGAVGIIGHLTIADNVHVTAMSLVTKSIKQAGSYSGGTGISPSKEWRRNAVRFSQLDSIAKRLNHLEKK